MVDYFSGMIEYFRSMIDVSTWEISKVDIGVMVGYLVLMMAVGWICKGISSNISDYVRMGCKSTWWLMGMSIFMQAISAGTFTGGGAQAYLSGWSFIAVGLAGVFGYLCQAAFFAPWLRRTRAITPADAVRQRYGRTVEQIYTYVGAFTGMIWGGSMLLALAIFMSATFNVPIPIVIIFVGVIVVFYSVSGGSWSVQITDTLQAYIMIPICLVVTFLSLRAVGGFGGLLDAINEKGLQGDFKMVMDMGHQYKTGIIPVRAGYFTIPWMIASFINSFVISANMTGCWRYLSTKSDKEARKAALFTAILLFLGGFIWYLPPMVARVKYSDEIQANAKWLEVWKGLTADLQKVDEDIDRVRHYDPSRPENRVEGNAAEQGTPVAAVPDGDKNTEPAVTPAESAPAEKSADAANPPATAPPAEAALVIPKDLAEREALLLTLQDKRKELKEKIGTRAPLANAADGAYALVAKKLLPPGLLGLVVIAMFAATMSSLDSSLTGNAGLITNNLYPPLIRALGGTPWEGVKLLRLTQVVNFCLGLWAIGLALWLQQYVIKGGKSVFDLGLEIVNYFQVPMVLALVLSFFVRRLPWWAPLVGMLFGFTNTIVVISHDTIAEWWPHYTWIVDYAGWYNSLMWHEKMFVGSAMTLIPTFATVRWWPTASESYRKQVKVFFDQLHTPVDFKKEVGKDMDHSLLRIIGGLGLIMAVAISVLAFFPRTADGKVDWVGVGCVVFIVLFIAVVSAAMYVIGLIKRKAREEEDALEAASGGGDGPACNS